jgi:hypothetical protein
MKIEKLHHIAIICSDYEKSKYFYTKILGFSIIGEYYREDKKSYKLDLSLNGMYLIELFSFENPPSRLSYPEASGLRHICFGVRDLQESINYLATFNIKSEPIRIDKYSMKKFTFFNDPDNLPIELYEI